MTKHPVLVEVTERIIQRSRVQRQAYLNRIRAATSQGKVERSQLSCTNLAHAFAAMLALPVERPVVSQTTALGAAYLAGLGAGVFSSLEELSEKWQPDTHFQPQMPEPLRDSLYQGWREAVSRTLSKGT